MIDRPKKFGDPVPAGWYHVDREWWLTWDALQKAFEVKAREIAAVTVTTRRGCKNEDRLRTIILTNPYNHRNFLAYSLDDFEVLWDEC